MENPEDPPGEQQPPPLPPPPEAEPVEAAFLTPFSVPGEFRACEALGPCCLGFCQDTPAPSSTTCCMLKTEALCGTQGSLGVSGLEPPGHAGRPYPGISPKFRAWFPHRNRQPGVRSGTQHSKPSPCVSWDWAGKERCSWSAPPSLLSPEGHTQRVTCVSSLRLPEAQHRGLGPQDLPLLTGGGGDGCESRPSPHTPARPRTCWDPVGASGMRSQLVCWANGHPVVGGSLVLGSGH